MTISNQDDYISGDELVAEMESIGADIDWHVEQIAERKRENKVTEIFEAGLVELREQLKPMTEIENDLTYFNLSETIFISVDAFEDYCQRFAIDCGEISADSPLLAYVDWERHAAHMRVDYTSINYDGEEYLYHS